MEIYSHCLKFLPSPRGTTSTDSLEMLCFDGGYFDANLRPHYLIADYLGSNIAVIDESGALVQSTSYYPYSSPHRSPKNLTAASSLSSLSSSLSVAGSTPSPTTNPYLFGGKELMTQDALNEYLYGARTYLPAATRFSSIDPLCEKYYHLSPYAFCAANPVRYTDPTGLFFTPDAQRYIDAFKQQIRENMRKNVDTMIKHWLNYTVSGKEKDYKKALKYATTVNSYIAVRDEINELEASSTEYDIEVSNKFSMSSTHRGQSGYLKNAKRFKISIGGEKEYGWLAHELKHAYQFETGRLSVKDRYYKPHHSNTFYDREDEIEAFERGMMFDNSLPSFFQVADSYKGLPAWQKQADPKATDAELQEKANENGIIFKVNGKLYTPNKK